MQRKLRLSPGDRVALWMGNIPEYVEAMWACWFGGFCVVPINAKLHPKEARYIIENSGASLCIASGEYAAHAEKLLGDVPALKNVINASQDFRRLADAETNPHEPRLDDPAWLFYTSGTTGRPKGATLTHRNLLGITLRYFADIDMLGPDDAMVHMAPFSHASGLLHMAFVARGARQIMPTSGGFDVPELFELMGRQSNLTFFAAPTMLMRIVDHPEAAGAKFENVRTILYGGAPMYVADLKRAWRVIGPRLVNLYAQGETPCTGTILDKGAHAQAMASGDDATLGSVGFARTAIDLRVVDEHGSDVPAGDVGEVVFRSDCTMAGYWENEEATRSSLREGWLRTGDLGTLDGHGRLTLRDRSKDLIISGGSNIYPREVEEVLLQHEDVVAVSVVGRPSPEWGEDVVAFVVPRPGRNLTAEQLDALCLDNMARFKRPKEYRFLEQLPKNGYGKVLKTELRKML
jgi:acyl-CoA synthetase (AMP-forming)/AMP-acid ligase II